jgi:hypothetical protein
VRKYLPLTLGLLLALLPTRAAAFQLDFTFLYSVCGLLPCYGGGGVAGASTYVFDKIVVALEIGFVAVAIIVLMISAFNMVLFSHEEDTVKNSHSAFVYTIAGGAVVGLARWFVVAFSPTENGPGIYNPTVVEAMIQNVLTFIRLALGILLTINIVVQAFRLINSQGEQDFVDKAKKRLISSFRGVLLVLIVNAIFVNIVPQAGSSQAIGNEIAGVANYLLTLLGAGAVIAIVIAGILLIVSVDESLKDKAKTLIKTAIVALLAVLVSYALVTAFIML